MRKYYSWLCLVVFIMAVMLTACSETGQNDYATTQIVEIEQEAILELPSHIDAFIEGIDVITKENNLDFVVGLPKEDDSSVSVEIIGKNDSKFEGIRCEIDWFTEDSGNYKQSFWLMFNTDEEAGFIKEFLTASIMYLGDSDFNTAQSMMQEFVNTYDTTMNSDLLRVGEYVIHIGAAGAADLAQIYFDHILEIENQEITEDEYIPIDYDMCQAVEMNKGSKFVFSGFVVDIAPSSSYAKVVSVQADDGNVYAIQMRYAYPVEVGSTYNFWVELFESDSVWASGANLKAIRIEATDNLS